MPATARRAGRDPRKGSRFLGQVLSHNVRSVRGLRRLTQEDLASRMRVLGHDNWVRATVSEVERYGRNVTTEELLGLALAMNVTIATLLEPTGIDGSLAGDLDVGLPQTLPAFLFAGLVRGDGQPVIEWKGNKPDKASFRKKGTQ